MTAVPHTNLIQVCVLVDRPKLWNQLSMAFLLKAGSRVRTYRHGPKCQKLPVTRWVSCTQRLWYPPPPLAIMTEFDMQNLASSCCFKPNFSSIGLLVWVSCTQPLKRSRCSLRQTQVVPKNNALNRGCTLSPPGKYDGFIFATAVMWPVATVFFSKR